MKPVRYLQFKGVTKPLCEWAKQYGLPTDVLWKRLYERNWPVAEAITTPLGAGGRRKPRKRVVQRVGRAPNEPWKFARLLQHFPRVAHLAPKVKTHA